jgi:hypothetical protein
VLCFNLVNLLFLDKGGLNRGRSGHNVLLFTSCLNREEAKLCRMRDNFVALFYQHSSQNYLWYPVEMIPQSNNDTTGSRLINNMVLPHIWLSQKNITDIQRGNITQYLILEGLDVVRHATLLVDTKISSLAKTPDVVCLWVCRCWQFQLFDDFRY